MKFNHLVKHDGVYYPAGTDVPISGGVTAPVVDTPRKGIVRHKYTNDSLPKNYMKLKQLAKAEGMEVGKDTSKEALTNYLLNI